MITARPQSANALKMKASLKSLPNDVNDLRAG